MINLWLRLRHDEKSQSARSFTAREEKAIFRGIGNSGNNNNNPPKRGERARYVYTIYI